MIHTLKYVSGPTKQQNTQMSVFSGCIVNTLASSKQAVRAATDSPLFPYTVNGTLVLKSVSNGPLLVDTVQLSLNDRVLVCKESGMNAKHNGVYVLEQIGDLDSPWVLRRSLDFCKSHEMKSGDTVFVSEGSVNNEKTFKMTVPRSFLLGTQDILWTKTGEAGNDWWKGSWDSTRTYGLNDSVSYSGTAYVCIAANLDKQPPNETYWDVLAQKGSRGSSTTVAILTDTKSNGFNGGTFDAQQWIDRTLNQIEGDMGADCTLSSSEFTLQPGTYSITAYAPAYRVDNHQARIYDVTESSVLEIGSSEFADDKKKVSTTSNVFWIGTVASQKTLKIQHRCQSTRNSEGLGRATGFGSDEIYTQVFIKKLS